MDNSFFGEWVYFDNEEEKEDAYKYLALWKKFMLKKLPDMEQVGQDQIVLRTYTENMIGQKFPINTLGIKIEMIGKKPENILTISEYEKMRKIQ